MVEPVVCIFPHSEFDTTDKLGIFLHDILGQRGGWYWLRRIGWKDKDFIARAIPGSLVLFRKKGFIVGQAILKTMIKELEPPEEGETETGDIVTYYHEILFVSESIEVYPKAIPIERIESWAKRKLDPRYYTIISTRKEYERQFGEA